MKREQKKFLRRERNKSHHDLISKNVLHAFQASDAFHALHDFYAPHTFHGLHALQPPARSFTCTFCFSIFLAVMKFCECREHGMRNFQLSPSTFIPTYILGSFSDHYDDDSKNRIFCLSAIISSSFRLA